MGRGCIIGESLEDEGILEGVRVVRRQVVGIDDPGPFAPPEWTFIWVELPDEEMASFAEWLSWVLKGPGWYADFNTANRKFVVLRDRVFDYKPGDRAAREEAEDHGRSIGVPEHQLDWPDRPEDPWPPDLD